MMEQLGNIINASASQVTIEKLFPLNSLAPGTYRLNVTVTDLKANQTVQLGQNFTVRAE
jgi:hypothetical protein